MLTSHDDLSALHELEQVVDILPPESLTKEHCIEELFIPDKGEIPLSMIVAVIDVVLLVIEPVGDLADKVGA